MQPSENYFIIAINKSILKQRQRRTIDHGKTIDCTIHIIFSRILYYRDDGGVDVYVDDELTRGG
jgi:hypothetical protein